MFKKVEKNFFVNRLIKEIDSFNYNNKYKLKLL